MAKKSLGYRYTPQASKLFKPAAKKKTKEEETLASLESQRRGLEKRFAQVNQPTGFEEDGQTGLLAELTGESKQQVDNRNLLEKALNLKPNQFVLMDILEVMDRPRQVVANLLSSLGEGDERNILEAAWEGLSGRKRLTTKEALQNLTGDESFLEIPENEGILDEVGNFVIDLGLDIVSDPTTYLGLGFITKPLGGAAKWAGKSIVELGEAGLKSTNKAAQIFGSAVDLVRKGANKAKFAFNAKQGLPDWFVKELDRITPGIGEQARKLKLSVDEIRKAVEKAGGDADKLLYELFESNTKISRAGKKLLNIQTPNTKITIRDLLTDMAETGRTLKGGKKLAYLLPNLGRQTDQTVKRLNKFINTLNEAVGQKVFRLKRGSTLAKTSFNAGFENAIEFTGTRELFNEIFFGNPSRGVGAMIDDLSDKVLRTQVTFKGAQLDANAVNDLVKRLGGVKQTNQLLARMRDITRKSRELLSDMGNYKIPSEVLKPGTRYARRVITKEGKEFIGSVSPVAGVTYKRPGRELLAGRTFSDTMLASEINRAAKAIYGTGNDIFNESAIASLDELVNVALEKYSQREVVNLMFGAKVVRDAKTGTTKVVRSANNANLFMPLGENTQRAAQQLPDSFRVLTKGQIKQEFSRLYNNLPDEMKRLWDKMLKSAGATGDTIAMQKSAYNIMKNLDRAYNELPQFLKFYDSMMSKWKTLNLLSPAFNMRNFIGNSTNMYLSGMGIADQIRYTSNAFFELKKYNRLLKLQATDPYNLKKLLSADDLNFMDEVGQFFREGISQSYANTRDLDGVLEAIKKGKEKAKGIKKIAKEVGETNFKIAEGIDNMQRYAMWKYHKAQLAKVNPGGINNSFEAAQKVREALFDYTNLTPFEKDYMKRLVPFYTFMKNNLIFQAKNITKMPNQYKKLLRGYKYWGENVADLEEKDVPQYMSGNMWLPIPLAVGANEEEKIMWLKANLPLSDFTEFVDNPLKKGLSGVTVPIKLAWELGTGQEMFTGSAIEQFPGQKKRMEDPDNNIVLNEIRGKNGEIYLSGNPIVQKISDELGFRTPRRLASVIMDVLDTATGAQTTQDLFEDVLARAGVTDTTTVSELELSALYRQVEELRNLRKLYEQNIGELPYARRELPKQRPLSTASVPNRAQYLYRPK